MDLFAGGERETLVIVSQVLWNSVEAIGLIAAVVLAINSPRLRRTCILVAVALLASLIARWGWALFFRWAINSDPGPPLGAHDIDRRLRLGQFAFDLVAVLSKALLIFAALSGARAAGGLVPAPAHAVPPHPAPDGPAPALPAMPPISKPARLITFLACGVLSLALSVAGLVLVQERRTAGLGVACALLSVVPTIVLVVVVATTIHALWKSIAPPPVGRGIPGFARTTPGKAVGLLFVPLFNVYWAFQAIPGFATDANRTLDSRGIHHVRASRGLGIAWCVCSIVSIVPFVGVLAALAGLVIIPMFFSSAIDAANALRAPARDDLG